jgi:hypothetical protein
MRLPEKARRDLESSHLARKGDPPGYPPPIPKGLRRTRCPKECVKYRKKRDEWKRPKIEGLNKVAAPCPLCFHKKLTGQGLMGGDRIKDCEKRS